MPLSMYGYMESMTIQQYTFCGVRAPPHIFAGARTSGRFEEPKAWGWGHRGRTEAAVDLGATLAGSSDCRLSKMRACSGRPLPALGPGALGKAARRHFPLPFYVSKI